MTPSRRGFLKQVAALSLAGPVGLLQLRCSARGVTPRAHSQLAEYDGLGLAQLVRSGQITPTELVDEVLRHSAHLNETLNAVVPSLLDEQAVRDRAARSVGDGRLAGVPIMLKNLVSYREAKIDFGSRLHALAHARGTAPAVDNSPFVDAIERAGMIVTGITNSPELGLIDTTEPVLHGATRNPWNPARSPGGSSGGAAAVVAAGIVPLAHGNDGAGSIRIPAACCGCFGLKPSRGREAGAAGATAALAISSELCLSRSVRDTAAFLAEVERHDVAELPPVGYVEGPRHRPLRIALLTESFQGLQPEAEVDRGVREAAALCEELGHRVTEVPLPIDGAEFVDAFIGLWATATLHLAQLVTEWLGTEAQPRDVLEPFTLGLLALAQERGREACLLRALTAFMEASSRMEAFFGQHDVLLSPVLRVPPFPLGYHDVSGDFETTLARVVDAVGYTPLQNATGMPGMSVPLHWTADGLPVGVQFSAWRGAERTLLELAYALEEARPWAGRCPPISVTLPGS